MITEIEHYICSPYISQYKKWSKNVLQMENVFDPFLKKLLKY